MWPGSLGTATMTPWRTRPKSDGRFRGPCRDFESHRVKKRLYTLYISVHFISKERKNTWFPLVSCRCLKPVMQMLIFDHTAGLSKDTRSYFGAVSLSALRTRARVVLRYLSSAPNTQVV